MSIGRSPSVLSGEGQDLSTGDCMFAFPQYDEALGPHDPATLQDRWPHPAYVRPPSIDVSAYLKPRTRIADRGRVRLVRPLPDPCPFRQTLRFCRVRAKDSNITRPCDTPT